ATPSWTLITHGSTTPSTRPASRTGMNRAEAPSPPATVLRDRGSALTASAPAATAAPHLAAACERGARCRRRKPEGWRWKDHYSRKPCRSIRAPRPENAGGRHRPARLRSLRRGAETRPPYLRLRRLSHGSASAPRSHPSNCTSLASRHAGWLGE